MILAILLLLFLIPLTIFVIIWDGFLIVFYLNVLPSHQTIPLIVSIVHLGVGIGFTYYVIAGYLNKTYILTTDEIFNAIDEASETGDDIPTERKMSHLFRGKAPKLAYNDMIVRVSKGRYKFNLS